MLRAGGRRFGGERHQDQVAGRAITRVATEKCNYHDAYGAWFAVGMMESEILQRARGRSPRECCTADFISVLFKAAYGAETRPNGLHVRLCEAVLLDGCREQVAESDVEHDASGKAQQACCACRIAHHLLASAGCLSGSANLVCRTPSLDCVDIV